MSDTEDVSSWSIFGGRVPPMSPSKARVVPVLPAAGVNARRLEFWSAHDEIEREVARLEASEEEDAAEPAATDVVSMSFSQGEVSSKLQELLVPVPESFIRPTHPGAPQPCLDVREPGFDPVSYVLGVCAADAVLARRFAGTDRKQFVTSLHRGFFLERWSVEERSALAARLLLLCALADDVTLAAACAVQLIGGRLRCRPQHVLGVALAWGAPPSLLPSLQPSTCGLPRDLLPCFLQQQEAGQQQEAEQRVKTAPSPARPPAWCVTHLLRALPALLCSAPPEEALAEEALDEAVLAVRALAWCALDAGPALGGEFVPALAALLASSRSGSPRWLPAMTAALHFPTAHFHTQAWIVQNLLPGRTAQALRSRLAMTQLTALLDLPRQQGVPLAGIQEGAMPLAKIQQGAMPLAKIQQGGKADIQQGGVADIQQGGVADIQQGATPLADIHQRATPLADIQQGATDLAEIQQGATPLADIQQGGVADIQQGGVADIQQGATPLADIHQGATPLADIQQGATQLADIQQGATQLAEIQQGATPLADIQQGGVADILQGGTPLADIQQGSVAMVELLQLLVQRKARVDALDSYRKFVLLLVLAAGVGDAPVASIQDATCLGKLLAWLSALGMSPAADSKMDAVLTQSLVACVSSRWQHAIEQWEEEEDSQITH